MRITKYEAVTCRKNMGRDTRKNSFIFGEKYNIQKQTQ